MPTPFAERRFGRLQVSMEFVKDAPDYIWALIFGDLRILRAEHIVASDMMHYEACGPAFEQVEVGTMPPWYQVEFAKSGYKDDPPGQGSAEPTIVEATIVKQTIQREYGW